MMKAPPRRPDPMPTRRTIVLVAAFPVAAFGAGSTALALSLGATAADASALAFVTDIYSAYNGKDAKGHPLDDERAIRRYHQLP
jgi:energy-converting hydrogenase Eha subunit A